MPDLRLMSEALSSSTGPRFRRLNEAMAGLLEDYSMVGFSALDIGEEDSVSDLLAEVRLAPDQGSRGFRGSVFRSISRRCT